MKQIEIERLEGMKLENAFDTFEGEFDYLTIDKVFDNNNEVKVLFTLSDSCGGTLTLEKSNITDKSIREAFKQ